MATITLPKGTTDLATLASLNNNILLVGEGNQTVISGLDQSALAAGLDSVYFQTGSTVTFRGSTGTPFKAGIATLMSLRQYGGSIYYTPVGAGTTTTCARIKSTTATRLYLSAGGTVASLECSGSSYTNVDDNVNVTTLAVDGAATVDALYKSTVFTTIWMGGGTLNSGRGFTTCHMGGGVANFSREDSSSTAPAGTTLNCFGGTLKWRGGNITTVNATGAAMLDFSDVPAACTIGTLNVTRGVLERSLFKGKNYTVTISTLNVFGADVDAVLQ